MPDSLRLFTRTQLDELDKSYRRNLINGLSGYKSLCLCATQDAEGRMNLAPMSSVIHVGAHPPLMGLLLRPHVVPRHTLENIEQTSYFSLNHVTEATYRQAHQASARYDPEQSEFEAVGLIPQPSERLPLPYVAEAPVQIGLKLRERHLLLANSTVFIVGEIQELRLLDQAIGADGFIDLQKTQSVTVSGLDSYHRGERLARLSYAKPDRDPSDLPL